MNRRTLLKGSAALSTAFSLDRISGITHTMAQTARYEVIDLVAPKDAIANYASPYFGAIRDINNDGTVVGEVAVSNVKVSPISWSLDGKGTKLKSGEFGGGLNAVSNGGFLAGYAYLGRLGSGGKSFDTNDAPRLWNGADPVELQMPSETDSKNGRVTDVNDNGVAVGSVYIPSEYGDMMQVGAVWKDGVPTILSMTIDGTVTPFFASKINADGLILGTASRRIASGDGSSFSTVVAATYSNDEIQFLENPSAYPTPKSYEDPYVSVSPRGLTNAGIAVIYYSVEKDRASISATYLMDGSNGEEVVSGNPDLVYSTVTAVSSSGVMVGTAHSEDRSQQAWLRWDDGAPTNISESLVNETGVRPTGLTGVNDDGVICGNGVDADGKWHGILLMPV